MANKKRKPRKWPYILIFLLGLAIVSYPLVSQYYYRIESQEEIASFEKQVQEMDQEEIIRRMELARAYNKTLDPSRLADPYSKKEKEGLAEYARMLEVEEKLGYVHIPTLDTKIPIYAGTSDPVLQKGAGHLEGTSLPIGGPSTHTVITAHRGLPTAQLFRHLDKVQEGDIFYLHNLETVLAYEVDQILVVEPSNFEPVLVVDGEDYATLLTCTPYMINSDRLLVRGHRVDYTPPVDDGVARDRVLGLDSKTLALAAGLLVLVLLALLLTSRQQAKKTRKRLEELKKNKKE